MSIFLASVGSFNAKNDNFHTFFFAVLVANFEFAGFAPKQRYTDWTVSMEIFAQRDAETKERKISLYIICPMSVLPPITVFADFKWFLCLRVKRRRFKARNFRRTPLDRTSDSKVKHLVSLCDVRNTIDFKPLNAAVNWNTTTSNRHRFARIWRVYFILF